MRAVKGKGGTKQLLHPRCFFDWLGDQIRGKDATQVVVISFWILYSKYLILKVFRPMKVLGSFMTPWRPMAPKV